jgi:subtilase family serine protease
VVVPASSQFAAADRGVRAHTNVRYIQPAGATPLFPPPYSGYAYETPASIACLYAVVPAVSGCNPLSVTTVPTGGAQKIAIVDAYDDPEAAADLAYFSAEFGLPFSPSKFHVVYTGGIQPPVDVSGGWEVEEALDIEYAHAMAPSATIYLVEAQSNTYTDLFTAVTEATNIIQCGNFTTTVGACGTAVTGMGEVSMSWGGGEFSGETVYDTKLNNTNVVYLASAGDSPGPIYPSTSPNVISVGGTTVSRSNTTGNFIRQITWDDGGSGVSTVESIPSYQSAHSAVAAIVGSHRGTPDISLDANPYTGVYVYDTFPLDGYYYSDWLIVGGTSVSAPTAAGIINAAGAVGGYATSTNAELTKIYNNMAVTTDFGDVTYGSCYYYAGVYAATGYDLCTGIGSPRSLVGK